jgi:imidazolonepropionase-like amidohydrolase
MAGTDNAQRASGVLFRNVRVFDGNTEKLSEAMEVLVRHGTIESISRAPGAVPDDPGTVVLDGGGRVLMPGLIDAHWHTMVATSPLSVFISVDVGYLNQIAARDAERTLMRGFTTVRDAGGPCFGLKRAIDEGIVAGPRIYPSGAFISQTGGHGDFRMRHDVPRDMASPLSHIERIGVSTIADGADEVLRASREQLMLGASQIKLMAGGGVSSMYDFLDVTQFTEAELHAAVQAAENWGTYVMVHAYTPRAVQQAVDAGVKSIEHGHLVDEPTVELMADKGVWWCLQPFLDDEDAIPQPGAARRAKSKQLTSGTDPAYELAKKHGVKLAWGTDVLFEARLAERQGAQLAKMVRWFPPARVLRMATADNAALLALSGPRNPYPGKLGVVEEGAIADLLLIDGNPLEDIKLLEDPARTLLVIMKDGKLCKNLLFDRGG